MVLYRSFGNKNGCFVQDILTATRTISIIIFEFDSREEIENSGNVYWSCHIFSVMRRYIDCGQYHWGKCFGCSWISGTIYGFGNFFASIINSGTLVQYSYNIGNFNIEKAQKIFSQGLIMSVLASIVMIVAMQAGENFFWKVFLQMLKW